MIAEDTMSPTPSRGVRRRRHLNRHNRTRHPRFATLPVPPSNPLSLRQQIHALKTFYTGQEVLRDAGGTLTRLKFGPVIATSPRAARDILTPPDSVADRTSAHDEVRALLGANLFTLKYDAWLPRRRAVQPVFTKHNVRSFGGHMAAAADSIVDSWGSSWVVDLDAECRRLALRAIGRSVFGIDLDERADMIAEPMKIALGYVSARVTSPIKPPRWWPTPARRRARAAAATLHQLASEILAICQIDPTRDAPLVRAMIDVADLTDDERAHELVAFMAGGHDTTATTLTYALWALGRHPDIQDRVRAEADTIGFREITPDDVTRLGYTVQVLQEALRLCPPAITLPRLITCDTEIDGYFVKAGTLCTVGIYAMHRDPALWDRPLEFDPDRFIPEKAAARDRWQYIPFGAGPRTCIGDHFAMLEATLALATIIRRTKVRSLSDDFPFALPFTMVAAAPIYAQVRRLR